MSVKAYMHFAEEPDRNKPVIMCSFCNEQMLFVSHAEYGTEVRTRPVLFRCGPCEYVWEFYPYELKWKGYSLEHGKWDEDE